MLSVYLLAGRLPLYVDLLQNPPSGIRYTRRRNEDYLGQISTYYAQGRSAHYFGRKAASILIDRFKIPPVAWLPARGADIIHSTSGILPLNPRPWVLELDYVGYFFGNNMHNSRSIQNSMMKAIVAKRLSSNNCRRIVCWSQAAKNSVASVFGDNRSLMEKTTILYPAVPPAGPRGETRSDGLRILYVSSSFGTKGGEEVLLAFSRLCKKFDDIELLFKCDTPPEFRKKFTTKKISFYPYRTQLLSRTELMERFYMSSDVFLYPTFADLFGLNLLDAMAAGLPIVSTRTFAVPEIVKEAKNGYLVDPPYSWHNDNFLPRQGRFEYTQKQKEQFVNSLVDKTAQLIESPSIRSRMATENRSLTENGIFSTEFRGKTLKRIYEDCVGN